jgi:hypothetical protein
VTAGRLKEQFRRLDQISYQIAHYEAGGFVSPNMTVEAEIEHIVSLAHFHQYGREFGGGALGRTLEYTFILFPSGRIYIANDPRLVVWSHRGGNFIAVSTLFALGVGQKPTAAMLDTARHHFDYTASRSDMRVKAVRTFGHGETPRRYGSGPDWGNDTACPGEALAFVRQYREEAIKMSNGNPSTAPAPAAATPAPTVYTDPVTHQDVHDAFLVFYGQFGSIERGVEIFGRPQSAEMRDVCEDGIERTVQFFERAVFEWHDDLTPGQVMLRRLGAHALEDRENGPRVAKGCPC